MSTTNEKGERIITLDAPQREGKDGYVGTIFGLYLRLGGIIADSNFKETDIRIYYMTKVLINLVPGEKNRKAINDKLQSELATALKGVNDSGEKNRIRNEICLECIGRVHDFVDRHIGVSIENRIGFVARER